MPCPYTYLQELRSVNFVMQFAEKGFHEGMPTLRDLASKVREHLFPDFGHLDLKFPVGGIFGRIGLRVCWIKLRIMKSSPDLTGKEKGPADTDGTDGVQLVCIKEDLGLYYFR